MDAIIQSFQLYYGLDWGALCCGMTGTLLVTNKNRIGFLFSMCGCACGFCVAMISQQYGFIAYNLILISIQSRGFVLWGRDAALLSAKAAAQQVIVRFDRDSVPMTRPITNAQPVSVAQSRAELLPEYSR